jgi:prepilin-type N-terminal cleavage/methylation domain-containing protein
MHPADEDTRGERGYTLAELLLVISLLAIIAVGAAVSYGDVVAEIKLDAAAGEIRETLEYARNQSLKMDVNASSAYGVSFLGPRTEADNGNWFQCVQKNGLLPLITLTHPVSRKPYKIDFDESGYYQGITITGLALDGNGRVFFDKTGSPSTPGTITIGYGNRQRTISISRYTGSVTVS